RVCVCRLEPARIRVDIARAEHRQKGVGLLDSIKEPVPPRLSSGELLIEDRLALQAAEVTGERVDECAVLPRVAQEDTRCVRHPCLPSPRKACRRPGVKHTATGVSPYLGSALDELLVAVDVEVRAS